MKNSIVIAIICAGLSSTGCSSPVSPSVPPPLAASGASPLGNPGVLVPFKGDMEGEYGASSGEFPIIHESIAASGQSTHLGRYTLDMAETVNLLQASATGTFTFTASNGDTIYGSYTGQAQPGPLVAIVENATVLGGTGRFADARGHFTIDRLFDPVHRTTTGSFDGAISAPGM